LRIISFFRSAERGYYTQKGNKGWEGIKGVIRKEICGWKSHWKAIKNSKKIFQELKTYSRWKSYSKGELR
jgi:hypothetical protein